METASWVTWFVTCDFTISNYIPTFEDDWWWYRCSKAFLLFFKSAWDEEGCLSFSLSLYECKSRYSWHSGFWLAIYKIPVLVWTIRKVRVVELFGNLILRFVLAQRRTSWPSRQPILVVACRREEKNNLSNFFLRQIVWDFLPAGNRHRSTLQMITIPSPVSFMTEKEFSSGVLPYHLVCLWWSKQV